MATSTEIMSPFMVKVTNLYSFIILTSVLGDNGKFSNSQEYIIEKYNRHVGKYNENKKVSFLEIQRLIKKTNLWDIFSFNVEEYIKIWGKNNLDLILFVQFVNTTHTHLDNENYHKVMYLYIKCFETLFGTMRDNIYNYSTIEYGMHPVLREWLNGFIRKAKPNSCVEYRDYIINDLISRSE